MYFDGTASSTTVEDLNLILTLCGLPSIASLNGLPMESDAGLALRMLRSTQRSVASRGWWFNTDRRVTLSPDVNSEIIITPAVNATASRPRPGEDTPPAVRFVLDSEGSNTGKLWNVEEDSWEFETDVMVDIVRPFDIIAVPQEFRDYCVYRTATQFAFALGTQVDPTREQRALFDLERAEADNMERCNVLYNDPHVKDIWYR